MKLPIYRKIAALLLCCSLFFINACTRASDNSPETQSKIESILLLTQQYGKDTVAMKAYLAPIMQQAHRDHDIPLLWAYNMLMADVYSIINDTTNPTSDGYYQAANQLLRGGQYPELEFITNARRGHYNFVYREIAQAFPYFLQANFIQHSIDPHITPALVDHYVFAAGFYSYIGNPGRAIEYLQMALPFTDPASRRRIDMLNSIGVYFRQQANDGQAVHYMEESLREAVAAKDSIWIGIISGNLSEYKWNEGKREEALLLLQKNIDLSARFNEPLDVMRCHLQIAKYYVALGDWRSAERHVHSGIELMEDKPYFLVYRIKAIKRSAEIASLKGDPEEERLSLKDYLTLKEQISKQVNNDEIKKIGWKFEFEKYEQTLLNNTLKEKQLKRTYLLIGLSLFLLLAVFMLLMNRSRHKVRIKNIQLEKSQLQLAYEKQSLDKELLTVKNSLTEFTDKINENNMVISTLRKDLANSTVIDGHLKETVAATLNDMLKSHLMTQERWEGFKKEFEIMYPNYLYDLKVKHPLLTENDMRIIALSKLNLNNRSMGDLLGISVEGIKKAKQRLKKKMMEE